MSSRLQIILKFSAIALSVAGSFLFCASERNVSYFSKYEEPAQEIKILFLGDLMFDRGIRQSAQKNGNSFIFEKIHSFLKEQDLAMANLEGPITDEESVSVNSKIGSENNYIFTFPTDLAKTLFDENIKIVNLGNNHIFNFGQAGLESTKKYLEAAGVGYFGQNINQLSREISGVKIAFINYNQFSGKDAGSSAANDIKEAKAKADIVVLFAHWGEEYYGEEYYKEPPAYVSEIAREFIDAGADLIIGSHSHTVQKSEVYGGKKIYYSLGNFVFDQYFSSQTRQGLGVVLKINPKTKEIKFEEKRFYLESNGQTILAD